MDGSNPEGPKSTTSIIATLSIALGTMFFILLIIPFFFKRKIMEFPTNLLGFGAGVALCSNIGYVIGAAYDFTPNKFETNHALTAVCWFFQGGFGGASLLLVFFYVVSVWQMICQGKRQNQLNHRAIYYVAGSVIFSLVVQFAIPFAFPHTYTDLPADDPRANTTVIFAPQGPWPGPQDIVVFTILFYLVMGPPSVISLVLGFQIIRKVSSTVRDVSSNTSVKSKGKTKLNRFYLRISIFIVVFSVVILIGMFARIIEIADGNWSRDDENDPEMGVLVVFPIIQTVQGIIMLSMPKVASFYLSKMYGWVPGISSSAAKTSSTGNTSDLEPDGKTTSPQQISPTSPPPSEFNGNSRAAQ